MNGNSINGCNLSSWLLGATILITRPGRQEISNATDSHHTFTQCEMNFNTFLSSTLRYFRRVKTQSHKSFPATDLDRPLGFQEVEAPEFLDNRHMKVVRLSALRTGRFYSQE
jgi:hypothetical protein